MHIHYLGNLVAHLIEARIGRDIAVLVRIDNQMPVSWCDAGDCGAIRAQTACVRVMQAQGEIGYENADYCLYSTSPPTQMCLGMAIRCHVKYIVFPAGDKLAFNLSTNPPNTPPSSLNAQMKGMVAGPWASTEAWLSTEQDLVRKKATMQMWLEQLKHVPEFNDIWFNFALAGAILPVEAPKFVVVDYKPGEISQRTAMQDKIFMKLAWALVHTVRNNARVDDEFKGQNIACVLVGPDGSILSWAVNTNLSKSNATRHAEVNCVQDYFRRYQKDVPANSTLYTTLQSCEMCAGMLATVGTSLTVVYGAKDPGVGKTALQSINSRHCTERRYRSAGLNPIAAQKFLALVSKRLKKEVFSDASTSGKARFQAKAPARPVGGAPSIDKLDEISSHKQALLKWQNELRGNTNKFSGYINARLELPQAMPSEAVTKALATPIARKFISAYAQDFYEMGSEFSPQESFAASASSSSSPSSAQDRSAWEAGYALLEKVRTFAPIVK